MTRTDSRDGVPIAYAARGAGSPALVFVHGWSCDRTYWSGQIEPFSREFRVVAVDLAGHGESGLGRAAWTIAAFGDDVVAVVNALALERIILIGHSMGGDVIVEAARRLPGRVAGLVWVDVYKQLGNPYTSAQVDRFEASLRADFGGRAGSFVRGMFPHGSDPSLVDRVVADMLAAPPEVAIPVARSAMEYGREVTATLPPLKLPVVAINPEDRPTDVESLKVHGVDVVLMAGVGHFLMLENAEVFNPLLRGVIESFRR